MDIIKTLAKEFSVPEAKITATVELFDAGDTIPFIARYRKEVTGSLDDQILRDIFERLTYLRSLEKRRGDPSEIPRDHPAKHDHGEHGRDRHQGAAQMVDVVERLLLGDDARDQQRNRDQQPPTRAFHVTRIDLGLEPDRGPGIAARLEHALDRALPASSERAHQSAQNSRGASSSGVRRVPSSSGVCRVRSLSRIRPGGGPPLSSAASNVLAIRSLSAGGR